MRGGQGRTPESLERSCRACFWCGMGFALVTLAVLAWELMK